MPKLFAQLQTAGKPRANQDWRSHRCPSKPQKLYLFCRTDLPHSSSDSASAPCREGGGGEAARQSCEVLLKYISKITPMHSVLNATDHSVMIFFFFN